MTNNTPDYEDNLYFEDKMDCKNCPYTDEYCASGDCERDNDLTEQWRNGTLPQDYYYVQYNSNVKEGKPWVEIELRTYLFDLAKVRDAKYCKILAPVPSYDELQNMNEAVNQAIAANIKLVDDNKRLKHDVGNLGYKIKNQRKEIERQIAQNAQLKDLLKEIKGKIKMYYDDARREFYSSAEFSDDLIKKIDEVLK